MAYAITSHDNYFCPTQGSISFTLNSSNSYSITKDGKWDSGNPYTDSRRVNPDDRSSVKVGCIVIKASRKDSSDVAIWATKNIFDTLPVSTYGAYSTTYVQYPDKGNPEDPDCNSDGTLCNPKLLNFALKGTLHIQIPTISATDSLLKNTTQYDNYDCPNIIIGQGSEKLQSKQDPNNWWLYSNLNITPNYNEYRIVCYNSNTNTETDFAVSSVNSNDYSYLMHFTPLN